MSTAAGVPVNRARTLGQQFSAAQALVHPEAVDNVNVPRLIPAFTEGELSKSTDASHSCALTFHHAVSALKTPTFGKLVARCICALQCNSALLQHTAKVTPTDMRWHGARLRALASLADVASRESLATTCVMEDSSMLFCTWTPIARSSSRMCCRCMPWKPVSVACTLSAPSSRAARTG